MIAKPMPLILLVGEAGVGKDTAAGLICELMPPETVFVTASAKSLKELTRAIFKFSDEQLYGPSAARNVVDVSFATDSDEWARVFGNAFDGLGTQLMSWGQQVSDKKPYEIMEIVSKVGSLLMNYAQANGGISPRYALQILGTEYGRALYRNLWIEKSVGGSLDAIESGKWLSVITDGRFLNEVFEVKRAGGIVIKLVGDSTIVSGHQSEKEIGAIPGTLVDYTIYNHKSLNGFEQLKDKLSQILYPLTSTQVVSYSKYDNL